MWVAQLGGVMSVISNGFMSRIQKRKIIRQMIQMQIKWTMDIKAIHNRGKEIGMANELKRCLVSFAGKCN